MTIGLKKPITVTERPGPDGKLSYHLVCGEGRLNAFRILGETHIPALVVDVSRLAMRTEDSVLRNAGIKTLPHAMATCRDLSPESSVLSTTFDIVFLLDQGEERLIEGVQRGAIPLTTALEIARAKDGDENRKVLRTADSGLSKSKNPAAWQRYSLSPQHSVLSANIRTYQKEVDRQRKMVLKAEHAHQRLLLVVQGLKKLFADESFVNLLRAGEC